MATGCRYHQRASVGPARSRTSSIASQAHPSLAQRMGAARPWSWARAAFFTQDRVWGV